MKARVKVVGERKVAREVDALRKRLGLSMRKFADLQAAIAAQTVVRNVQPFGTAKKAREQGEKAVRRDLGKVFRIVRWTGPGVVQSAAEARRWHQGRRNARGRTTKGQPVNITPAAFFQYEREVLAKVGRAKGSVMGGKEGPGARIPGWVKRWAEGGTSTRRRTLGGALWVFRSNVKHVASDHVLGVRGLNRILRKQAKNVRSVLRSRYRRELEKAQRRIN